MSSRVTIPAYTRIIQEKFIPALPEYWRHQFRFGVQALTLKPFVSLASNARQTVAHPDTAGTTMDRLASNQGLAKNLARVVANLGMITPKSILACDHSVLNGLMTFMAAIQTGKGRAIPCLVETLYAQQLPATSTAPKRKQKLRQARKEASIRIYDQALAVLEELAGTLGFWPRLVFDRGFGGLPFIRPLVAHGAIFYIRIKVDRLVELGGQELKALELPADDTKITLDGMELRVIRSDQPDDDGEPWLILTSDMKKGRRKIIRIYYHRFEIEETFKDLKHILGLKLTRLNKPLSLKVLLWFTSLRFILAYLASYGDPRYGRPRHPKKKISWMRRMSEEFLREIYGPVANQITGGL
jgi:hypothetical protein